MPLAPGSVTVGILHPGEMGAAIGHALQAPDVTVLWASEGRSPATTERADAAGLEDAVSVEELCRRAEIIVSVCPPHAALEVADAVAEFSGLYVDANAVSPTTARTLAGRLPRFVDGGIVGPPPREPGATRLYLAGAEAGAVAELFSGTYVDARVLTGGAGAASALKMAYAAWTKGSAALLLASRAAAEANGVAGELVAEWQTSLPGLEERLAAAARGALGKGWRWVGEMEEIAQTLAAAGLPPGFHEAAAEIYGRVPREQPGEDAVQQAVAALLEAPAPSHLPGAGR